MTILQVELLLSRTPLTLLLASKYKLQVVNSQIQTPLTAEQVLTLILPAYALDVNGTINSNTAIDVGGVPVCTTSTCITTSGSSNYIQNSTTVQTGANIFIRASASNTVAAVVQGTTSQTSDLLDLENWNGSSSTILDSFASNGSFLVQNSSSSNLLQADTSNMAVGINGASTSAGYNLNVTGSINASGTIYENGVAVCTSSGCAPSATNFISNQTTSEAANFNVQAASWFCRRSSRS